jgi:hypothetical protein
MSRDFFAVMAAATESKFSLHTSLKNVFAARGHTA